MNLLANDFKYTVEEMFYNDLPAPTTKFKRFKKLPDQFKNK